MTDREDNHSSLIVLGNPVSKICPWNIEGQTAPSPPPYIFEVHEHLFYEYSEFIWRIWQDKKINNWKNYEYKTYMNPNYTHNYWNYS